MDVLASLSMLTVPLLIGAAILSRLGLSRADDPLGYFGWVYVTGLVAVGVYLTIWLLLGLPLVRIAVLPPLVVALILSRPRASASSDANSARLPTPPAAYTALVAVLIGLGLSSVSFGSRLAIMSSDEAHLWALKGKMIYTARGFGPEFRRLASELDRPAEYQAPIAAWMNKESARLDPELRRLMPDFDRQELNHLDYPLLNPLLHVWAFTCFGEVLHWQNRLLIQGCAFALLLILAGALLRVCRPLVAAALLVIFFALVQTENSFRLANSDAMVATGLLLAVESRRRWQNDRRRKWIRLGAMGLALMVWSKHEGLMYLVALAIGCVAARPAIPRLSSRWLLLPVGVIAFTWSCNTVHGFSNDLVIGTSGGGLDRARVLLCYFWDEVLMAAWWSGDRNELNTNFVYLAFLVLTAMTARSAFRAERRFLTCTILSIVAGQLAVYAATPHRLEWHLASSASRFTWQAVPVMVLWLGLVGREFERPSGAISSRREGSSASRARARGSAGR